MCLSDVLVRVLGQQGEVTRRDHFPEDGLSPLLTCLVLELDLQVLRNKPGCRLDDLYYLVLEDEQLASE